MMAIRDVLVQVDGSRSAPGRFAAAIGVAQTHAANLIGLCLAVEPPVPATILGLVPPDLLATQHDAVRKQADGAAAQFRHAVEQAGLHGECRSAQVLNVEAIDVFVQHTRHADLVILSQSDPEEVSILGSGFPAAIVMGGGRPAIVIPYIGPGTTLGRRVLVAWDGGREATRAVHDALPILERADSVTVLSINPDASRNGGRRDPGADISLHLARHGVKTTAAWTIANEISVGDAILADIADNGIDLLVMGAYGHSRLREVVLGGATRHLLEHMTVPVLMSH
jgi:nucleotide-binding universal stress UspA family protein